MRFWPVAILVTLTARLADGQAQDSGRRPAAAPVTGIVHDSLTRTPLAGATVQLVSSHDLASFARSTVSDHRGRFAFEAVPGGRYTVGFFHAMLDSLGLEPPLREVEVKGGRRVRVDLAIPSASRLRSAICGPRTDTDHGGVLVGIVRDARDGHPMPEATVSVEWAEVTISRGAFVSRTPRRFAMTLENGYYAICGVPSPGTMMLRAAHGADSTDWIEVQTPDDGFLRRELWLGAAHAVRVSDSSRIGALLPLTRVVQQGDGLLAGTVVTVAQGKPLMDALVSIVGGPETRTNDRGQFRLTGVPGGTRTLLVRAVGYYPAQRSVDVVPGAAPVHVQLMTFRAVLDTVKVTGRRIRDRYRGFEERRRSASGVFVTADQIARWRPLNTSDIFRFIPAVKVVHRAHESIVVLRGAIADTAFADTTASAGTICQPMMFLNGRNLFDIPLEAIDTVVLPEEIDAIEVYVGGTVPPQYDDARRGCGAIVIWTR
jgi:hypothetical protein